MEIKIKEEQFRKDIDRYFQMSGIRECEKLNHSPFIVINKDTVELCHNARGLMDNYPPEAKVLAQWRGQWRSDFFLFNVYDFILFIRENPKREHQII